jgi:hypothetical protein
MGKTEYIVAFNSSSIEIKKVEILDIVLMTKEEYSNLKLDKNSIELLFKDKLK